MWFLNAEEIEEVAKVVDSLGKGLRDGVNLQSAADEFILQVGTGLKAGNMVPDGDGIGILVSRAMANSIDHACPSLSHRDGQRASVAEIAARQVVRP